MIIPEGHEVMIVEGVKNIVVGMVILTEEVNIEEIVGSFTCLLNHLVSTEHIDHHYWENNRTYIMKIEEGGFV